jgi:hypothetical protein
MPIEFISAILNELKPDNSLFPPISSSSIAKRTAATPSFNSASPLANPAPQPTDVHQHLSIASTSVSWFYFLSSLTPPSL